MNQRIMSASRRNFVTNFAVTSGALALGLNFGQSALAEATAPADLPKKLDLQVVPSAQETGGLIFEHNAAKYLLFKAIQTDELDREQNGTAIIELAGCCAMATAHYFDDVTRQPGRPRYYDELDSAAVYELENSSWLASIREKCQQMRPIEKHTVQVPLKKVSRTGKVVFSQKTMTVRVPNIAYHLPSENAHHFAFSFRKTTFHCVAEKLNIEFQSAPFRTVLETLQA